MNKKETIRRVKGLLIILENDNDTDSEIWLLKSIFELLKAFYKEKISENITGHK
jgi:hypothetical protein